MSKLGEMLKEQRLAHGFSFEKITNDIRLSEDIVRQLEDGGFKDLPSYNHAKNFVKNYAEYLGFKWDEILPILQEECNKSDFNHETPVFIQQEETAAPVVTQSQNLGWLAKFIIPAIIVIAVVFAGARLYTSMKKDKAREAAQAQVQPQTQTQDDSADDGEFNTVDQKTVQDTINNVNAQEQSDQTAQPQTDAAGNPVNPADAAVLPAGTPKTDQTQTAVKTDPSKQNAATPADNTLKKAVLNFGDVCWVHVKSDTGEETDFIADKKSHTEITFKQYFVLDVGNAAVASVSYNGQTVAGLGGYKMPAKGLKFQPDASGSLKYTK